MSDRIGVSLFSGIGGIDLAFARAGFDIRVQVEIEPYCQKILAKHAPEFWPHAVILGDVKNVGRHNLPFGPDVLLGGFPCTDISSAGKGAGIKEGNRSGLWFEFARIIGEIRPRYVFIENVPAITTRGGTTVAESLAALGYAARWHPVSASDAGAPHGRKRWFCVAYARRSDGRRNDGLEQGWQPFSPGRELAHSIGKQSERAGANGQVVGTASADQSTEKERQWIWDTAGESNSVVAHAQIKRHAYDRSEQTLDQSADSQANRSGTSCGSDGHRGVGLADANSPSEGYRYDGASAIFGYGTQENEAIGTSIPNADHGPIESRLGGIFDGLPARLDTIRRRSRWPARPGEAQYDWEAPRTTRKMPHRAARLKALGNSVVPQCVFPFAQGIWEALNEEDEISDRERGD